jgi:hypothetical protein
MPLPVFDGLANALAGVLFGERLAVCRKRLHDLEVGMQPMDFGEMNRRNWFGEEASSGDGGDHHVHLAKPSFIFRWPRL